MGGKPRWLSLGSIDQKGFAFGADVCHSFLRWRGVRQMPLLKSRAIPMRRSYQFSSCRRYITSPPGSLEGELKIHRAQSPPVTLSVMLWNPISCVLWPLGNFVYKDVVLWFNCTDTHLFFLYISPLFNNFTWWRFFLNFHVHYVSKTWPIFIERKKRKQ